MLTSSQCTHIAHPANLCMAAKLSMPSWDQPVGETPTTTPLDSDRTVVQSHHSRWASVSRRTSAQRISPIATSFLQEEDGSQGEGTQGGEEPVIDPDPWMQSPTRTLLWSDRKY